MPDHVMTPVAAADHQPAEQSLVVRDLTKSFGRSRFKLDVPAVNKVSFQVRRGGCLAVVGESGSGKTTIARMVSGLTTPTSGSITFGGLDVADRRNRKKLRGRVQMVFQDPYDALNPRMRIGESIQEPITLSGGSVPAARARTLSLLKRVQLDESFVDRHPTQLSGGQLQRVGIARALAADPEMIILDEPTSALDWMTRCEIIDLLNGLRREMSLSYLFISHDISAVAAVSDDIVVMQTGNIVEAGPAARVLSAPDHPYTQTLLGSVLEAKVASRRVRAPASVSQTPETTD